MCCSRLSRAFDAWLNIAATRSDQLLLAAEHPFGQEFKARASKERKGKVGFRRWGSVQYSFKGAALHHQLEGASGAESADEQACDNSIWGKTIDGEQCSTACGERVRWGNAPCALQAEGERRGQVGEPWRQQQQQHQEEEEEGGGGAPWRQEDLVMSLLECEEEIARFVGVGLRGLMHTRTRARTHTARPHRAAQRSSARN